MSAGFNYFSETKIAKVSTYLGSIEYEFYFSNAFNYPHEVDFKLDADRIVIVKSIVDGRSYYSPKDGEHFILKDLILNWNEL